MPMKSCSVCQSPLFEEALFFEIGYMSDGTKTNHSLVKEECQKCGTLRTKVDFDWSQFYQNTYCPSRNIDTPVVSKDNVESTRSGFVYEWITSLLKPLGNKLFSNMLEIGCGQGYLLDKFDVADKFGIEPSTEAALLASEKAHVRNIGYEALCDTEKYDLIISYCVIEHLENPELFLEKSNNLLADGGVMIIALPIQDKFNYDLFFMDHLYHFSHNNFSKLLKTHGFDILNYELGRESYSNIGLYVCKKADIDHNSVFVFEKNTNIANINKILSNIDNIITHNSSNKLFAFGYGEIAKTIIPYTVLDDKISYYIDDFNQGEKVISSVAAKEIFRKCDQPVNLVLLVNPKHENKIKNIFHEFKNIHFMNIFEGIDIE